MNKDLRIIGLLLLALLLSAITLVFLQIRMIWYQQDQRRVNRPNLEQDLIEQDIEINKKLINKEWAVYEDETLGLRFEHPSNWQVVVMNEENDEYRLLIGEIVQIKAYSDRSQSQYYLENPVIEQQDIHPDLTLFDGTQVSFLKAPWISGGGGIATDQSNYFFDLEGFGSIDLNYQRIIYYNNEDTSQEEEVRYRLGQSKQELNEEEFREILEDAYHVIESIQQLK